MYRQGDVEALEELAVTCQERIAHLDPASVCAPLNPPGLVHQLATVDVCVPAGPRRARPLLDPTSVCATFVFFSC